MKKPLSVTIYSQNWMRQAEKQKKENLDPFPFTLGPGKKIPEKIAKKFKKFKKPFPALFLTKTG